MTTATTEAAPEAVQVTTSFVLEKETKNTKKYEEVPESGQPPIVGSLYLQKFVAERLGNPETVTVTITAGS